MSRECMSPPTARADGLSTRRDVAETRGKEEGMGRKGGKEGFIFFLVSVGVRKF